MPATLDQIGSFAAIQRVVSTAQVGVQVISLDQAPEGDGEFDAGVPKKFLIDPHKLFSAASAFTATQNGDLRPPIFWLWFIQRGLQLLAFLFVPFRPRMKLSVLL